MQRDCSRHTPRAPAACCDSVLDAVCSGAALVVLALAVSLSTGSYPLELEAAFVRTIHVLAFDEATAVASEITDLAATRTLFGLAALAAVALLVRGQWHGALAVTLSVIATQAIVAAIKGIVERGRPPGSDAIIEPTGYAFPSAHAAGSMAVYGLLALLVLRRPGGQARVGAAVLALALVVAIGTTRVYLGAHYPSDVIAGWLVGAVIAAGALRLAQALRSRVEPAIPIRA
jgi:membrane-associated phospholipid phosphatase